LLLFSTFTISSCSKKKEVKLDTTPTKLYEKMINNPAFKENPNGEGFCWQQGLEWMTILLILS